MSDRTYTDDQLVAAVAGAQSWRAVLRALGLRATSAGSIRSVRRNVERLGLSTAHFTGQRRWSDSQLHAAVAASCSWPEVARALDLSASGTTVGVLKAHALRLGLATDHFTSVRVQRCPPHGAVAAVHIQNLRSAGSYLAAAWFTLRGASVSWPLEPCRYDLVVDLSTSMQRVQVKTTSADGQGVTVVLSSSRRVGRAVYEPGEIDSYFVIDGGLDAYLIPYSVVAGYGQIQLSRYADFKVAERGRWLDTPLNAGASP